MTWERHRSRPLLLPGLAVSIIALSIFSGLFENAMPHGHGYAAGFLTGLMLGGGFGLLGWSFLSSDGSHSWRIGALGEQWTGAEMRKLGSSWTILHGLLLPGANGVAREVDHVAIGPTGIFAVDSKLRTGHSESLNRIPTSLEQSIRGVERQANVIRYLLKESAGTTIAAHAVTQSLMIWGPEVESANSGVTVTKSGTWLVHGRDAEAWRDRVAHQPYELDGTTTALIVDLLRPYCTNSSLWDRFRMVIGRPPK